MGCNEICYSSFFTLENVMVIDMPSRRMEKVPTTSKRAISSEIANKISQI